MAKSLEELDNALHPGHQYRHIPGLEFQWGHQTDWHGDNHVRKGDVV